MLSASFLAQMDDEHLLAVAIAEQDPLTSTPLELELTRRLQALLGNERERSQCLARHLKGLQSAIDEAQQALDDTAWPARNR
jgi:hypothetical protein